ncbi:FliH/SctL family protein [Jatrophihabitans sp. DSM 45814]
MADSTIPSEFVERSRTSASAVGYAQGWAQGVRDARDAMSAENADAVEANIRHREAADAALRASLAGLAAAATQLHASIDRAGELAENTILKAAVDIAEALLGKELGDVDKASRAALARCLKLAPPDTSVSVRIAPGTYENLSGYGFESLLASIPEARGLDITFEPDAALGTGDAIVRAGATTIDGRLSEGLRLIRERLAS